MIVRYWQPLREVESLHRQLDRVFDEMNSADMNVRTTWTPAVNLIDQGDNLLLQVQLPGVTAEDIDIQASREAVAISGQRQMAELSEGQRLLHSELRYGTFRRVVPLPVAIQNTEIAANFDNGILMLTLPKVEEVRNRVVKVNIGQLAADAPEAIAEAAQ
ncbi:MAG: Hsp20/alpha crystallin family protein [Leptolyngbya sp. SIO4C5]|uniref:Hsp20/alpha crystallin family protein n=1 Tax=Sphaerothrix gracilis TaxID=3151835 RepID=UPI0013C26087|nr:Hsp20/alpha crystallin family protein [Leptolyngbya sp. SIO4C5]